MNLRHLGIIPLLGSLLILPITAIALTNPISANPDSIQLARSLSPTQIRQLAQAITVKVLANRELGSGILIAKQGTNYTVLTNAHVLNAKGNYRIQTPDGKIHSAVVINKGSSLQGNDLAVLQFSSPKNYRIVTLATATTKAENQSVYAAGFAIDSQQLLITTGKISLITPKPLAGGYQLGYTNQIKQGMSGGPLLNQSGELIGVNGLLNNAILNDTYTYLDGSSPTNEVRQQLRQLSFAVPIATLAQLPTQETVIPSQERNQNPQSVSIPKQSTLTGIAGEVDLIAQQITLRIDSKNNGNGSGVIIARQGQTYYVLTASHVVKNQDQYTVLTPDREIHIVKTNDIFLEAGLDVAILKFSSQKEYPVATLARYNLSDSKSHWVFLSGFPGSQKGHRQFSPGVRFDKNQGFFETKDSATNLSNGYELVFTNLSLPGMSGGPLLDVKGQVIGIGGRSEGEAFSAKLERNLGHALGVSITTGLGLATKAGIKPEWMKLETSSPPTLTDSEVSSIRSQPSFIPSKPAPNADENEWLNYGNLLWRLGRNDEAVGALEQAIAINPEFYQAYYVLGLVLQSQKKYPEAMAAFKQVTQLNSDYYQAWREQSSTFVFLKNYPQALAAIEQAIKINAEQADKDNNPQDFILYVNKGNVLKNLKRYAEAEAALNEAINIKPSEIAYNNRGILRAEQKNYLGAEADYNQAIRINPENAEAYNNRGILRTEQKNYQGAEADYNQAIRINPEDADAYINRGVLRKEQKNYPGAEADYNQAIRINPEDAYAYNNRGSLRTEQKNYLGAEADYNQAIRINPQYANAYGNRGILRTEQKNYPGAEADYNQAIRINSEDAQAYNNRGILRYESKNYPGAEADFTQAIKINPEYAEAYANRGILRYESKNYPGAEADYNQAIRINPEYAEAYYNRGNLRYGSKNYQGAEADYNQAIRINPEYANAYNNRGVLREEQKNYPGAEADFTQAIRINPQFAEAYTNRVLLRNEQKNYPGAEADYTQAIRINSEDAQAYNNRGILRYESKNYPGAEADFTQAIKINPEYAEAYANRGILRYESKNYPGAEADYNQAIRINPQYAEAYYNRGILRYRQRNYPGAEADYNQAIRINPQFAEAYVNRGLLRSDLKNYPGAEADYNQAIRINPKYAEAYNNRGFLRYEQKNYPGAEADYNQAIRINPEFAKAYYNRGILRTEQKNYQGVIADLQIAAQLYRKQGNPEAYQQVQQALSQLQALPSQ